MLIRFSPKPVISGKERQGAGGNTNPSADVLLLQLSLLGLLGQHVEPTVSPEPHFARSFVLLLVRGAHLLSFFRLECPQSSLYGCAGSFNIHRAGRSPSKLVVL
eukprot:3040708-Amphidinium_carterae.1